MGGFHPHGAGVIVSFLAFVTSFAVAVIVTSTGANTGVVRTSNGTLCAPTGTGIVSVVGSAMNAFAEGSATSMSPGPAGHSNVTAPATVAPPTTGLGVGVTDFGPIGFSVRVADKVQSSALASMVALSGLATALVRTGKLFVVAPALRKTLAGTIAFGLSLESAITEQQLDRLADSAPGAIGP